MNHAQILMQHREATHEARRANQRCGELMDELVLQRELTAKYKALWHECSGTVPAETPVSTLCALCGQIKELHPNTHPWTPKAYRMTPDERAAMERALEKSVTIVKQGAEGIDGDAMDAIQEAERSANDTGVEQK